MKGYLYLLLHPDMPGLVKIGRTTRLPQQRLAVHYKSGIVGEIAKATGKPWQLVHYVPVTDASKAEAYVYEFYRGKGAGKVELMPSGIDGAMEALMYCALLDKERYQAMLGDELRNYDVSELLKSISREHRAIRRS